MSKYICEICGYVYDEAKEGTPWSKLPADWACPLCTAPYGCFKKVEDDAANEEDKVTGDEGGSLAIQEHARTRDDLESNMELIHEMAQGKGSRIEAMRTRKYVVGFDDILLLGGQLAHPPLA